MSHKAKKQNSNYKGYTPPETPQQVKEKASTKVPLNTLQKVLTAIALIILAALSVWAIVAYGSLPDEVATDYSSGVASDYMGKGVALLFPIAGFFITVFLAYFNAHPKNWNLPINIEPEKYVKVVYGTLRTLVAVIMVEIAVVLSMMEGSILLSVPYPVLVMSISLIVMFGTLLFAVIIGVRYGRHDIGGGRLRRRSGPGRRL